MVHFTPVSMMATTPFALLVAPSACHGLRAQVVSGCCERDAVVALLPACSVFTSSLTWVSRSRKALWTPLTPRIASIEPIGGAQREARKCVAVLAFHLRRCQVGAATCRVDRGGRRRYITSLAGPILIHDARGSVIGGGLSFPINHLLALSSQRIFSGHTGSSGSGSGCAATPAADCAFWVRISSGPKDWGSAGNDRQRDCNPRMRRRLRWFAGFFSVICPNVGVWGPYGPHKVRPVGHGTNLTLIANRKSFSNSRHFSAANLGSVTFSQAVRPRSFARFLRSPD